LVWVKFGGFVPKCGVFVMVCLRLKLWLSGVINFNVVNKRKLHKYFNESVDLLTHNYYNPIVATGEIPQLIQSADFVLPR